MRIQKYLGMGLLISVLTASFGCGLYHVEATSNLETVSRTTYPTLAILPPTFMMEHRPHHVFQYTYDLVQVLTEESGIPTIAPWEYDPDAEFAGSSRDAMMALVDQPGVSVVDLCVLEFRIEEANSATSVLPTMAMGGGVNHAYEADVQVTLILSTFPQGEEIARVSTEFSDRPFASGASPANPRPVLREAIRLSAGELAEVMNAHWFDGSPGLLPDLAVQFNPVAMFRYQGGAGEPLENDFTSMDEFDRMAYSFAYYEYFAPDVSTTTVAFFENAPPGLLVSDVGTQLLDAGLREQDFITAVNGVSIGGPQSLMRSFMLAEQGSHIELTVVRDGSLRNIDVAVASAR